MVVWQVPEKFRPLSKLVYPPHQTGPGMEVEIANRLIAKAEKIKTDLIYCPINWTAYYCNNEFGNEQSKAELQEYINTLPKDKKFFTVVQYDDGIMVDFPNCMVFAAGGKPDDAIPIPLLCDPHKVGGYVKRDIPISLVANLNTHPIRQEIARAMYGKGYCYIGRHDTEKYVEILRRSHFTICPRGYGKTSFRMYEAIQLGTIPVYITDEFWLPFLEELPWDDVAVISNANWSGGSAEKLIESLFSITQDKGKLFGMRVSTGYYSQYFTYDYVAEYIRRKVEHN